ncbi:MAG: hypothetical protein SGILL_003750 [Bacillariaceae sp.]
MTEQHQLPKRNTSILRNSSNNAASEKKAVIFDKVEVKYHKIILGDNPGVSDGAPITIHWKAHHREVLPVDDFEQRSSQNGRAAPTRSSGSNTPSKKKDLRICVQDRAMLLLKSGYSLDQIGRETEKVQEIRQHRQKSAAASAKWDGLNVALESSGKAFKKMIGIGGGGGGGSANKNAPVNPAA